MRRIDHRFFKHCNSLVAVLFLSLLIHISCNKGSSNQELDQNISIRNLFVATDGRDANSGSIDKPLASIELALNKIQPGDTVFIRGGIYPLSEIIEISKNGQPDAWITVMNYDGEVPVFDAKNIRTYPGGSSAADFHNYGTFFISNASYIRIIGIRIKNSHGTGFMVRKPNTHNIQLIDCKSEKSYSSGMALWYADSCSILNCEITGANDLDMRPEGVPLHHEAPHEALTVAGAQYFEVAGNQVHHCIKEGIDCKEISANGVVHDNIVHDNERQGLYADSWFGRLHDITFHHNIVYNCEWGMAISAEGQGSSLDHVYIHHNTFYNNRGSGIFFSVWGHDALRKDVYVFNNTIYHNGDPMHWAGPTGGIDMKSSNLEDIFIFNNICAYNKAFEIATFDDPEKEGLDQLAQKNI